MNTALTKKQAAEELHDQLRARSNEFANALPSHIKPEYFQRATLTAIAQNPQLLNVDRRSLFTALMKCAQDGLIPDGREAVLVIHKDRDRGAIATYEQMTAGVRKLLQQSGEITRFEQTIVHQNDKFEFCLGDHPQISHVPALGERGDVLLLYSIAQFKDGTLSREVMTIADIEKRRAVSRYKDGGPWVQWWPEMAKKTIAKYHAKSLPKSNEAATALAHDDAEHYDLPAMASSVPPSSSQNRPRLADRMDALGEPSPETEKRPRRGRPKKNPDEDLDEAEIERSQERLAAVLGEEPDGAPIDEARPADADVWHRDYDQGKRDALAGRAACLNREIFENDVRHAQWQKGFDSVKK